MPSHGPITDEQPRTRVRLPADPHPPETAGRRSHWGSGISALLVIALVIAAVAFTNRGASDSGDGSRAEAPAPPSGQAPSDRRVAGVAVGYAHTATGAESAATNYAVAYGSAAMVNRSTRHKIIHAIADPAVEATLQAQLDAAFERVRSAYDLSDEGKPPRGLRLVYRTLPAGTHLTSYAADTATVEIWTNGLAGLAGRSSTKPVVEAWNTMTVNLRWVDGDWRWVSFSQKGGPTPVSGVQPVSDADSIADADKKFGAYRYAR